jgi:hypothetical protein
MLASAQEKDQIPIECFAKKGSNCINAVMIKVMFFSELRTHHHPMCISGKFLVIAMTELPTPLLVWPSKALESLTQP